MDRDKLMKMASAVRTGGKGTMRRKKKAQHKTTTTDDKRLQSTLKRLGVNTIPGIEEVNLVKDDGVIHFANPKVQASIAANTYVVSGISTNKTHEEAGLSAGGMMGGFHPDMLKGMDPDTLAQLQKLMAQSGAGGEDVGVEEDDDVPDLVENFDETAK